MATEQPLPAPPAVGVVSIQELMRRDLVVREQVGVQRYGTPLYANNGRDALRDAYEEAVDLALYLRQAIEERDGLVAGRAYELASRDLREALAGNASAVAAVADASAGFLRRPSPDAGVG